MSSITLAEIHDQIEKMPFSEKLGFYRNASLFTNSYFSNSMEYDGYVCKDESQCVSMGDGKYYVYVWKHNYGEFFYVGSGHGDRWRTINPRCNEFYDHLDKADAVVFKVMSGLDEKTARRCERYLSTNLALAGYKLSNHDFSYGASFEDLDLEISSSAEKAIYNILMKQHPEGCRATMKFLETHGEKFFTEKYAKANSRRA